MTDGIIVKPGQLQFINTGTEESNQNNEPPVELLFGSIRWRDITIEQCSDSSAYCTQPFVASIVKNDLSPKPGIQVEQNDNNHVMLKINNDQLDSQKKLEYQPETDDQLDHRALELGTLKRNDNIKDSLALLNEFLPTDASTSSTKPIKDSDQVEKVNSGRRKLNYKETDENQVQKPRKHKSRTSKDDQPLLTSGKKKCSAEKDGKTKVSDFSNIDFDQLTHGLNASALTSETKVKKI